MTIHAEIKRRRTELGWSHEKLAAEISLAEGLKKPLAWQTVQQWEKTTAPKRTRLPVVAAVLKTTVPELTGEGFSPGHLQRIEDKIAQLGDQLSAPMEKKALRLARDFDQIENAAQRQLAYVRCESIIQQAMNGKLRPRAAEPASSTSPARKAATRPTPTHRSGQ